jgi:hypothetical protein
MWPNRFTKPNVPDSRVSLRLRAWNSVMDFAEWLYAYAKHRRDPQLDRDEVRRIRRWF